MHDINSTRPHVVLIAEDDPGSLMALATCLELDGYIAVPAANGEAARIPYLGDQVERVPF